MYFIDYGLWCLVAISLGLMEGFMYHLKDPQKSVGKDSFLLKIFHWISLGFYKPNEHAVFNIVRTFMAVSILWSYPCSTGLLMIIAFVAGFPFFHDGMYYYTRNRLNDSVYKEKWLSDPSSTTTSIIKLTTAWRVVLLIISLTIVSALQFFA